VAGRAGDLGSARWLRAAAISVLGAAVVGLGVAVVAGVAGAVVASGSCDPGSQEVCYAPLAGYFVGLLAGGLVATVSVAVLGALLRLGLVFCLGAAGSFVLLTAAGWLWLSSDDGGVSEFFLQLAVLVLGVLVLIGGARGRA
jgi:hypothetical protein